jgi:hypothetical protein
MVSSQFPAELTIVDETPWYPNVPPNSASILTINGVAFTCGMVDARRVLIPENGSLGWQSAAVAVDPALLPQRLPWSGAGLQSGIRMSCVSYREANDIGKYRKVNRRAQVCDAEGADDQSDERSVRTLNISVAPYGPTRLDPRLGTEVRRHSPGAPTDFSFKRCGRSEQ